MEAIWVAAEMRAGGAYAHAVISLTTMNEARKVLTAVGDRRAVFQTRRIEWRRQQRSLMSV